MSRSIRLSHGKRGSRSKETARHRYQAADAGVGSVLGNARNERSSLGSVDAPHRRSCRHGCRRSPHGSAIGTKSSYLRTCRALPCYLVLHGTIRSAFHSGIHPHLPQRRRDASSLPSPVVAGADGCTAPGTPSALALWGRSRPGFPRCRSDHAIRLDPWRAEPSMPTWNGHMNHFI